MPDAHDAQTARLKAEADALLAQSRTLNARMIELARRNADVAERMRLLQEEIDEHEKRKSGDRKS